MSAKGIYEFKGKQLLNKYLGQTIYSINSCRYDGTLSWSELTNANPWLLTKVITFRF
jgi:hypothetical protein